MIQAKTFKFLSKSKLKFSNKKVPWLQKVVLFVNDFWAVNFLESVLINHPPHIMKTLSCVFITTEMLRKWLKLDHMNLLISFSSDPLLVNIWAFHFCQFIRIFKQSDLKILFLNRIHCFMNQCHHITLCLIKNSPFIASTAVYGFDVPTKIEDLSNVLRIQRGKTILAVVGHGITWKKDHGMDNHFLFVKCKIFINFIIKIIIKNWKN